MITGIDSRPRPERQKSGRRTTCLEMAWTGLRHRTLVIGIILSLFLCLETVLPAQGQYFGRNKVQYENFSFRVLETEHFDIHFYPLEERAARDAARMSERWYNRHTGTFQHEFDERKPLIFYANTADFQQTNVIRGLISEAVGGATEPLKERVVMPFTPNYGETNHVLGHELVHSFQFDIAQAVADTGSFSLQNHPQWLTEGMAEYLSVGQRDPHTAMWIRDAALQDDLPTIEDLATGQYFPYRFGEAYLAYIGGTYGDQTVADLFIHTGRIGIDSALVTLTGQTPEELSEEWIQTIEDTYLPLAEDRMSADEIGEAIVTSSTGEMEIGPAMSPDGRYVAFVSRRNVFTNEIFVADTETGEILDDVGDIPANPHLDEIRFLSSSGSWSPDSRRFAFVVFAEGDNAIAIWDGDTGNIERTIPLENVQAITNVAWSPDGERIALSGMAGGVSDLFTVNLQTDEVRRHTDDRYAAMQPAWSPDGERIAFTTDRGPGGSRFDNMNFAEMRLGVLDLRSGEIQTVRPFEEAAHHNPQFAADGESLFFISNQDGFKDIYRHDLTSDRTYRITRLQTGVSGVTELSPAMSVAYDSGEMAFSVFNDREYHLRMLPTDELAGEPVETEREIARAGILPPVSDPSESLVTGYLNSPEVGLPPETEEYPIRDFSSAMSLTQIAPPQMGVQSGGMFGTQLQGGIGFYFSDMLENNNLMLQLQAQGRLKDIGGQAAYINQSNRLNLGITAMHFPQVAASARVERHPDTGQRVVSQLIQRVFIDEAQLMGSYPFSQTRRMEATVGLTRYGFDFERVIHTAVGRQRENIPNEQEPDPIYLGQGNLAYVTDYSFFGFTSPMMGARYRLGVTPRTGSINYVTALADYRRYFFMNPVTFALRGLHRGNYGANTDDLFALEYLGNSYYPGFVRGYGFQSFRARECPSGQQDCAVVSRLVGTRIAMASAEFRVPLFGTEQFGVVNFPYLPTELTLFADGGVAWTAGSRPELSFETDSNERVPVFSAGAAARINILGSVVAQIYWAYPFQRPDNSGGVWGFLLQPGW